MKVKGSLALVAAAAMLTACVSSPEPRPAPVVQQQPQGVEGNWQDPNGLVSTFMGGKFETRTADGTNTQMASGTYTQQPDGLYQLSLYSNVNKTTSLVNCRLGSSGQLLCTSQNGKQFALTRKI
ncbi:hypothetical protein [Rhizobium sp. FKY42]|uniref:hypothetical protein n=1 Tax=Rhizobium sp. FKY42 TaxID=2562310 RepID=UPI0010C05EC1|nr:hypothetical protein [Rhizobium sp. FKY42]